MGRPRFILTKYEQGWLSRVRLGVPGALLGMVTFQRWFLSIFYSIPYADRRNVRLVVERIDAANVVLETLQQAESESIFASPEIRESLDRIAETVGDLQETSRKAENTP